MFLITSNYIKRSNPKVLFEDFDYAVIRYRWNEGNGRDLDTRTSITVPSRGTEVGWDRAATDGSYLQWGGDNTGSGVEAVLLDVKSLSRDYSSVPNIEVAIKAFWFSSSNNGNISLEFETYIGGSMIKSGYDFVNSGGVLTNSIATTVNTFSSNRAGELLARLTYNVASKNATLIKV